LHVAEKNSVAKPLARILSQGRCTVSSGPEKYCPLYTFQGDFRGTQRTQVVTSVRGHLLSQDFDDTYRQWNASTTVKLFDAPIKEFVPEGMKNLEKQLIANARKCNTIVLWLDCDREGEAIAAEVVTVCNKGSRQRNGMIVLRAQFSVVNEVEIRRAIASLRPLHTRTVNAVKARQEIDLRLGAIFTRFQSLLLQKRFQIKMVSYGPCQTPTLGFVVNRHLRIQKFVKETFWSLFCEYGEKRDNRNGSDYAEFAWNRTSVGMFDRACAIMFLEICLANPVARVMKVERKQASKWAPKPLATTTLSVCMSRWRRLTAKRAVDAAERLYSAGYISYPRTDTEVFRPEFDFKAIITEQAQSSVWGQYANSLLSPENFRTPRAGSNDDKAHPPIHPVKFVSLDRIENQDERHVYELVVRHFLACCSRDAYGSQTRVEIKIASETFSTGGLEVIETNYLDVYIYEKWTGKIIPSFSVNQEFEPSRIDLREGVTTPPKLLKEHDLLRLMENAGIGTDATMAQHIETIKKREYVYETNDHSLAPTPRGIGLVEAYQCLQMDFAEPRLRAKMEADCKLIELGNKSRPQVVSECLREMKDKFRQLEQRQNEWEQKFCEFSGNLPLVSASAKTLTRNFMPCANCEGMLDLMERDGSFFQGSSSRQPPRFLFCSNCTNTHSLPRKGRLVKSGDKCPICNSFILNVEHNKGYKICPSCYGSNPPESNRQLSNTSPTMPCFSCRHRTCPFSRRDDIVVHQKCQKCRANPLLLKTKTKDNVMTYRISCKGYPGCKYAVFLPSSIVKLAELGNSTCSRCGMQKLLIELKPSIVAPGERIRAERCARCDNLLS
jgi:DNA topoisomerase III